MQDLIIVCAGGYGKEVYSVVTALNREARNNNKEEPYRLLGFINDIPDALEGSAIKEPILGTIKDWYPKGNEVYALGLGKPSSKEKVAGLLKSRGCKFVSLIAPWSIVSKDLVMGEGCFVTAYSISAGVKLGNFVNINGSMLLPGAEIDDYSTTTGFTVVENAKLGKRVHVGSHAVISDGVVVGDDASVCAGSVVTEDVKPGTTVIGVPAADTGW